MRILLVCAGFALHGANLAFFNLAKHLQATGHEVFLFPCGAETGPMRPKYRAIDLPVVDGLQIPLCDVMIANSICSGKAVFGLAQRMKTIWIIHETDIGLRLILQNPELIMAFKFVSAIIFQSDYQKNYYDTFTQTIEPRKFHVIPNGLHIETQQIARFPVEPKRRAIRVVQVGSVETRKRPGDLIQAIARSQADIECFICGHVFGLDEVARSIVSDHPAKFYLLGEIEHEQALAWVESADIFCLASSSESQPLAVFEAAMLRRPLLLSDLPCYQSVFTHGVNCVMFPAANIEFLRLSLEMLVDNPMLRDELGQNAFDAVRHYTLAAFLARFDAVVISVLGS